MNILVTDKFYSPSFEPLLKAGHKVQYSLCPQPSEQELKWAHGLFIRSRTCIDVNVLQQATGLKFIVTATSGQDHIDLKACQVAQVKVQNLAEANAQSAAELTLMLMLQTLRRWAEVQAALKHGKWKQNLTPGRELYKKRVGLVGLGHVGSRVAQLLKSFHTHTLTYDPYKPLQHFQNCGVERVENWAQLFQKSTLVSLHVPLTESTYHMVGASELQHLGPEGVLINTSRGGVLDEKVVFEVLQKNPRMACGLDVFSVEPLPMASPWRDHLQVVLSPHIGALTQEALQQASRQAVQYALHFANPAASQPPVTKKSPKGIFKKEWPYV